ncbi:arylmalonate decarboxylase [Nocardiopsis algeriensis]|uniref:maleate cis-trans isomerase family protein n=1 Tax=Nocardiopsis algeriensis TaxID=1478215 RepID=UPI003B42858C
MTTVLAPRAVFGVIVPSTNTVVEDEYYRMRPEGVSYHAGRILIEHADLSDRASFEVFLEGLRAQIQGAIDSVLTCLPDHLIMGMSAETFWGGAQGNAEFEQWVRDVSGLEVTSGAAACDAALKALGARRIGVITPYQPIADEQVRRYFTEIGYDVAAVHGLRCSSATSIAHVTPDELEQAFRTVDGEDVDVLVQAGTNLPVVGLADRLERELGKPVIAINSATVWHALRTRGIDDKIMGAGRLLREL